MSYSDFDYYQNPEADTVGKGEKEVSTGLFKG
jgi:hypothetical protein